MTARILLVSSIFVSLSLFTSGLESKEFQKQPLLEQKVVTKKLNLKQLKKVAQSEKKNNGRRRGIFLIPQWESFCQPGLTSVDQFATVDQIRTVTDDLRTWIKEVSSYHLDVAWDIFGPFSVADPQVCFSVDREYLIAYPTTMLTRLMLDAEAHYPDLDICDYDYVVVYPASFSLIHSSIPSPLRPTGERLPLIVGSCNKVFGAVAIPWLDVNRPRSDNSPARRENDIAIFAGQFVHHEFGHALGLQHASALDCHDVVANYDGTGCDVLGEYGNRLDTMGGGKGHFNAADKEFLGWATTRTIDATNATYEIEALEIVSDFPKALKINVGGGFGELYIEYRLRGGYPSYSSDNDFYLRSPGGLALNRVSYSQDPQMPSPLAKWLNCTPSSNSESPGADTPGAPTAPENSNFQNAVISLGQTCNTNLGFTITFTSVRGTRATVRIDYLGP